jgi:ArsR family transcriptional regulator, arsenate/arsenite/antimonite-responsive transcriptional repressor
MRTPSTRATDALAATAPPTDAAEAAVAALRFLGDANRLRIVQLLSRQESCVQELTDRLGLPQPLVSYHLRRLREVGVARPRRHARRVYYAIDRRAWAALTQPIRDVCAAVDLPADAAAPPDESPRPADP